MASPAGRGAQVILDGDAQAAARGAVARDINSNTAAKRALEEAGLVGDGFQPDGASSTGLGAEDEVLGIAGKVDGTGIAFTAPGTGAASRTVQAKLAEFVFSVADYGAKGDGSTDDGPAIQRALNAANASGGGTVFLPPGIFRKAKTSATLIMYSNTTLAGVGDRSVLFHDDDIVNARRDLLIADNTQNICFRDFKILGTASTYPGSEVNQSQNLTGSHVNGLRMESVTIEGVRFMATAFQYVTNGVFTGNKLVRVLRDGIRCTNSNNISVIGNSLTSVTDDCIALHSLNEAAVPGSGFVVTGNTIDGCQSIKVLGAKRAIITSNTISRGLRTPIEVRLVYAGVEGTSPQFDIDISHNIIQDTFGSLGGNEVIRVRSYPYVPSGSDQPGITVSPVPFNWTNDLATGTKAVPGTAGVRVNFNTITRTLPNAAAYSSYGYGPLYDRVAGWPTDPAMTDATFATHGITLYGAMRDVQVIGNRFDGGTVGFSPIRFTYEANSAYPDFVNVLVAHNIIRDCPATGAIVLSNTGTQSRNIIIRDNILDLDPYRRASSHNADNTWSSTTGIVGISSNGNTKGFVVTGNWFSHCASPISSVTAGVGYAKDNFVLCDPNSIADDAANKGVRALTAQFDFIHIKYDGNPLSATFGQIDSMPLTTAAAMPTSGWYATGHFVRNHAQTMRSGILGWFRVTTGSTHVEGTDWRVMRVQAHPGFAGTGKVFSTIRSPAVVAAIPAVDTLYFYPVYVPDTLTVVSIRFRTSVGGAGSAVRVGIWRNNPVTGTAANKPVGAPLTSATQAGAATTGNDATVTITLDAPIMLSPGWYWLGVKATGTLPTMYAVGASEMGWMMGADTTIDALTATGFAMTDAYANALPTLASGQAFTPVSGGIPAAVLAA